jgi:hypothetical protein
MPAASLMTKLTEIQRRVESKEAPALRGLVLAAQEDVLELERKLIDALADNTRLRQRLESCERIRRHRAPFSTSRQVQDLFESEAVY